jgi:hypothetical protein
LSRIDQIDPNNENFRKSLQTEVMTSLEPKLGQLETGLNRIEAEMKERGSFPDLKSEVEKIEELKENFGKFETGLVSGL